MDTDAPPAMKHLRVLSRVISFSLYTLIPLSAVFLITGILSGSLTVMAITFDCGLGLIIQFVGFFSIRTILKSNIYKFPYGTGKLENFTSLLYGVLSIPTALFVMYSAVGRLMSAPVTVAFGIAQLPLIPALARSTFLCLWTQRLAKKSESPMVYSYYVGAKICTMFNVAVFFGISVGFLLSKAGQTHIAVFVDPLLSILIAVYLLYNGVQLTVSNFKSIADFPLREDDQLKVIAALTEQYEKYDDVGNIYTRMSGDRRFITIEVYLNDGTRMKEIGELEDAMRASLEKHFSNMHFSLAPRRAGNGEERKTETTV